MHPALSVIFFTTLSGAGFGLLLWLGLSVALLQLRGAPALPATWLWALGTGTALAVIGLLCSLAHLGRPLRAWRALSQWRTSWLSREGVLALACLVPAIVLGALLWRGVEGPLPGVAGALLALLALGTVVCTAMIYASLPPIPAWRHPLVVPVYLLFALLTGMALMHLVFAVRLPLGRDGPMALALLAALALVLAVAKWLYWRDIDRTPLPATRGDAVGLPGREVSVFERPHTGQNFITREMAFVLARRHSRLLRLLATALLAGAPLLACLLAAAGTGPVWGAPALAFAGTLAASFVERWLFFAEARHVVTLYY